jgi:hypothetical protein
MVVIYFKALITGNRNLTRISVRFPYPVKLVICIDIEFILSLNSNVLKNYVLINKNVKIVSFE